MSTLHYSDLWQEIAKAGPDRLAIVTREERISYGRLAAEAGSFAGHLTEELGLLPGEAVATMLYNRPEYLAFLWGTIAVGIAPVSINYRYRAAEVRALLVDSAAKAFVVPTSLGDVAAEAASGLPLEIVTVDDGGAPLRGSTRYEDIVVRKRRLPPRAPAGGELRLYTGGTTGAPKGVVWDLDTLLTARQQSTWEIVGVTAPDTLVEAVQIALDPGRRRVVTLPRSPLLHGTAQSNTMATLALGGTVVLTSRPSVDMEDAYRLISEQSVTRVIVAGDALALPLAEIAEREHGLPTVDSILSSGMRFSDEVKSRLHALGSLAIIDIFASSEGGPYAVAITRKVEDLPAKLVLDRNSVLLDEDGNLLPASAGTLGLIGFGGTLPKGYHGDPVKTAATFRVIDGHRYVVPGDWARVREDGTIDLIGRLSAVVNSGGEKIFPGEVEEVLLEHPAVGDAVVFGLPDRRFGEAVSAMVAPYAGMTIDVPELLEFVGERLAGYKKPRHVFVRPDLGRTATGKIELSRIRAEALLELAEAAR
jgi:acyl-CoA synthetase (AMP-forming)/AMP-acid ligase II